MRVVDVCVCVLRGAEALRYIGTTPPAPFLHLYTFIQKYLYCVYIVPYANTTRTHVEGPTYSYWVESYPINLSRISLA